MAIPDERFLLNLDGQRPAVKTSQLCFGPPVARSPELWGPAGRGPGTEPFPNGGKEGLAH